MSKLQDDFNSRSGDYIMPPGEYEGPLVVNRPCVVDGSMSTLWAKAGPALVVNAEDVTIRNLRVEVVGAPRQVQSDVSIQTNCADTVLSGVEASGKVVGFAGESEEWSVPPLIALGEFAAGKENNFSLRFDAPAEAELSCGIKDVEVSPRKLRTGEHRVSIRTPSLRENTILYGELFVKTAVTRRIYINGKAVKGAPAQHELPSVERQRRTFQPDVPGFVKNGATSGAPRGEGVEIARRGQRVSAKNLQNSTVRIACEYQDAAPELEIDGSAFLLQKNGKVRGDDGLIFFGNRQSDGGAVRVGADGEPAVFAELNKAADWVDRIAVCFSIYDEEDSNRNFSQVSSPRVRLYDGDREMYRLDLTDLSQEKTVVALEFYRYKGEWKINFVGSGYRSGLRELCENYGVDVE